MNTRNLIPVKYKKTTNSITTTDYGLIANKTLTDCVPNLVNKTNGTMNYNALFAMLISEIHQLNIKCGLI